MRVGGVGEQFGSQLKGMIISSGHPAPTKTDCDPRAEPAARDIGDAGACGSMAGNDHFWSSFPGGDDPDSGR